MSRSLRILIAEDNADLREYIVRLLPRLGHEVAAVAENGRELIEQFHAQHPDVVITDIRMPVMDGLEAIRVISRESAVPFIVISSEIVPDERIAETSSRIINQLPKPFRLEELEAALSRVA